MTLCTIGVMILLCAGLPGCTGASSEKNVMLEEVSGVWQGVSDGALVTIDLTGQSKTIQIADSEPIPFTIKDVDVEESTVALSGKTVDGQSVVWTIQQLWDDEGERFTLLLITHTGDSDELDFVRRL